jgi:hypothetical protein
MHGHRFCHPDQELLELHGPVTAVQGGDDLTPDDVEGTEVISSMLQDSRLTDEVEVVWRKDPTRLDCVRQALDKVSQHRGKPRYSREGRLLGYTNLSPDAERDPDGGLFARRAFFSCLMTVTVPPQATTRSRARRSR